MITGIAHVCFTVRSMDASLTFYRQGLGMTEASRRQNEPMNGRCNTPAPQRHMLANTADCRSLSHRECCIF